MYTCYCKGFEIGQINGVINMFICYNDLFSPSDLVSGLVGEMDPDLQKFILEGECGNFLFCHRSAAPDGASTFNFTRRVTICVAFRSGYSGR